MIDLISLVLNTVVVIFDITDVNEERVVTLSGIAVLFLWLRLFYFGRIFETTAAMIRMVIEITKDMRYFLLVLVIAMVGFGNSFFILARNTPTVFTGGTFLRAFIYSYRTSIGDFNTDGFDGDSDKSDKHLLYFLWFIDTMITLIVLLNMLIAIMGDTFDKVQETFENNMLQELTAIMCENEMLVNRKIAFGDSRYIIVIQPEKADESNESWEGKLQYLKKYMYSLVDSQNKLLKSIEKTILNEFKEKIEVRCKDMETSTNKYINSINEKSDIAQNGLDRMIAILKPVVEEVAS